MNEVEMFPFDVDDQLEKMMVENAVERDLAFYANQISHKKDSGYTKQDCINLLKGTGFLLYDSFENLATNGDELYAGALISGRMDITYFIEKKISNDLQEPILFKKMSIGSTFFISKNIYAEIAISKFSWVIVKKIPGDFKNNYSLKPIEESEIQYSSLDDLTLLAQIDSIDFSRVDELVIKAQPILSEIASRRNLMRILIDRAENESGLRESCELLNEFYKYVLYRSSNDIRLRLHVFRPDAELHAHAHRWSMVSYVLNGPVTNKYYGTESDKLLPFITHRLEAGSCYAFVDSLIHWFRGAPGSATLTLRGPVVKDSAMEFRRDGLIPKFGVDANKEPSLKMSDAQFEYGVSQLRIINII